jgi:hypothetical protein
MGVKEMSSLEDQRKKGLKVISIFLLMGYIFPVYLFRGSKLVFTNIQGLKDANFLGGVGLFFPLIAGIVVIYLMLRVETMLRPVTLIILGVLPVLISLTNQNDVIRNNMKNISGEVALVYLIMLSLIGIFVGSKVVVSKRMIVGHVLGGLSGILFLLAIIIPLSSTGKPIAIGLFEMFIDAFKWGILEVICGFLILGVALCYTWASILAVMNLKRNYNSKDLGKKSIKLVFYTSLAAPVILIIFGILGTRSSRILTVITSFVKLTLLIGGIIGLITMGLTELLEKLAPKETVTNSEG